MGKICPKCGYERTGQDTAPDYECPSCGIVYAKFVAARTPSPLTDLEQTRETAALVDLRLQSERPAQARKGSIYLVLLAIFVAIAIAAMSFSTKKRIPSAVSTSDRKPTTSESSPAGILAKQDADLKEKLHRQNQEAAFSKAIEQIHDVKAKWDDADKLANASPRIGMTGPISTLQAIRREAAALQLPECVEKAKKDLVDGMDNMIDGYIGFMSDPSGGKIYALDLRIKSIDKFELYEKSLAECVDLRDAAKRQAATRQPAQRNIP